MARKVTQARLNLYDALERANRYINNNMARAVDPRLEPNDAMLNEMVDVMFHAISTAKSYQIKINPVHVKGQRA